MFNLNAEIVRQRKRRNRALHNLKCASSAITETATAEVQHLKDKTVAEVKHLSRWNPVENIVQKRPWESCAMAFGAGLMAPKLLSAGNAAPPHPQRVVVEVKGAGTLVDTQPPAERGPMDFILQALKWFDMFRAGFAMHAAAQVPESAASENGHGVRNGSTEPDVSPPLRDNFL